MRRIAEIVERAQKHYKAEETDSDNAEGSKAQLPLALLPPLQAEVSVILGSRIKSALASLEAIVHLDRLTYNLTTDGIRNIVVYYLRDATIHVILVNSIRVTLTLASAINITGVCKLDDIRMNILLRRLLGNENKINAMLTHNVNSALEPTDSLLVVDKVLHLVKHENTIVTKRFVVKIPNNIMYVGDRVILDKCLVNVRQRRQCTDTDTRNVGKERTVMLYARKDYFLHCEQRFSRSRVTVVD